MMKIVVLAILLIFTVSSCTQNDSISDIPVPEIANEVAIESAEVTTPEPTPTDETPTIYEEKVESSPTPLPEQESFPESALVTESSQVAEPVSEPELTLPPRENTNFRNAIWGDSPETVIAYETADYAYPDTVSQSDNYEIASLISYTSTTVVPDLDLSDF